MSKGWSTNTLRRMLYEARIKYCSHGLRRLTTEQWDALGDYAYYLNHPKEKDPFPGRDVAHILAIITDFCFV